ncbi:hypothetical protein FRC09_019073 [Ceratobasidium sp. 395]|nr:hypothetical protein FRC09_019073 [Ceratobasidium sp. 395]
MRYECIDGCDRTGDNAFHSRKSRTMHQGSCPHVKALNKAIDNQLDACERPSKRPRLDNLVPDLADNPDLCNTNNSLPTPIPVPVALLVADVRPPPPLTRSRARRLNTSFREQHDTLPEGPPPLPRPKPAPGTSREAAQSRRQRQAFATEPDLFG